MTMQHTHLTAWQTWAPWPKRSQLEQDLRLSRGVAAIFNDDVLREHLAMRGGTVLHKAHLAPAARYSEDIDLVLVKPMDTDALERHLNRVLVPVLGRASESLIADAWLAIRNVLRPSKILRMAYRFVPLGLQREQGRDLFDLAYAWQLSEAGKTPYTVDGAKAMQAFTWYLDKEGTQLDAREANTQLDARLHKPGFRRDMETLLRPGLPAFDVDKAATIVRKVYFRHLP